MPKYTVQNGSVIALINNNRVTLKVGDELELTKAQAEKMDRDGFYLCPSSEYGKAKKAATKTPPPPPDEDEYEEELDDDELEQLTKPTK